MTLDGMDFRNVNLKSFTLLQCQLYNLVKDFLKKFTATI